MAELVSHVQTAPLTVQAAETHGEPPSAPAKSIASESSQTDHGGRDAGPSDPEGQFEANKIGSSSALNVGQLKGRKHKKKMMIKTLEKKLKVLERHIKK